MKPLGLKMVPPRIAERTSVIPILLLVLLGLNSLKPSPGPPSSPAPACRAPTYVQVEGEVRYPGVYSFCWEPGLAEVLSRAVALDRIGKFNDPLEVATLTSGEKILVIREGEACKVSRGEIDAHYKVSLGIPLSANRESEEGLTAIPGIGVKLAGAIVRERERRGGFKTIDEIAGVPGIGRALHGKIKSYLTL
jgi:competence protein ComEA